MSKSHKIKLRFTKSRKRQKKLMNEAHARPVGSAELFASSGLVILQDGSFNIDVQVNRLGPANTLTGKLDEDSMDVLIEMGAIKPLYRRPPAEEEDFPALDEV
jgi:hypothetical protein